MAESESTQAAPIAEGRDQIAGIEEQEQLLRRMLGSENDFLVDLLHAGMEASEFRRSRVGRVFLEDQNKLMGDALKVLRDPGANTEATLQAAYKLRVAYASTMAILGTIVAGKMAESNIDKLTSD